METVNQIKLCTTFRVPGSILEKTSRFQLNIPLSRHRLIPPKATVEISDLIDCLRKRWSSSENEEVVKTVASCSVVVNPVKPPTNIHAIAVKRPEFM